MIRTTSTYIDIQVNARQFATAGMGAVGEQFAIVVLKRCGSMVRCRVVAQLRSLDTGKNRRIYHEHAIRVR